MPARVYIETYGCQMNVADSGLVGGVLRDAGYELCATPEGADVVLVNTCAVRERAEERVYGRMTELWRHKQRDPRVVLGLLGCMAEHLREQILARAPYVDLVMGPDAYRRLPELLAEARGAGARPHDPFVDVRLDRRESYEGLGAPVGDGVSAFVTVQRGCDKFCAFCVVPFTRGRERATPPREVLRQVRALAAQGYREVTLLGQTVNSYRHEEADFADLLEAVAQVEGVARIRFTSPYPVDFSPKLIATMARLPKVCRHVHLPVQSGDDGVLARMGRGYTVAEFRALAAALRAALPGVALTTDVIVGFCDETEDEYRATVRLLEELRFDAAFTFEYSERSGTPAARAMPDTVSTGVKRRRLAEIIALQEAISLEAGRARIGAEVEVLVVGASRRDAATLFGRTGDFKKVLLPAGEGRGPGALVRVRVARATGHTLFAEGVGSGAAAVPAAAVPAAAGAVAGVPVVASLPSMR
ncbi:MAG TPA: tRNA (N6-isopentenyl adenosine(37)-C2)-methylthiotransferase MiaB [Myxococcota bacterium]|nr:tRNA (N6-isopentenyl adenosine(37)-C2)-methylthiotransferase MiaB [Myxococcota bacterium]